jgi:hypothetical protein
MNRSKAKDFWDLLLNPNLINADKKHLLKKKKKEIKHHIENYC